MNSQIYLFLWWYFLFTGVNGATYLGMNENTYNGYLIGGMALVSVFGQPKLSKMRSLLCVLLVVTTAFIVKAYLLRSSGAFVYSISILGAPVTYLALSNYLNPLTKARWGNLSKALIYFFVVEIVVAYIERILGSTFVGFGNISMEIEKTGSYAFRSCALWGHPLTNALVVSVIMNYILFSSLRIKYKLTLWAFGFFSLLCFNARAAIILNVLMLVVCVMNIFFFSKKESDSNRFSLFVGVFLLFVVTIFLLSETGLGGRLTHGSLDDSSVQTRIDIWNVFDVINRDILLYGTDNAGISTIMIQAHLWAMENFWILYVLRFGLVFLIAFIVSYFFFLKKLFSDYKMFDKLMIICAFLMIASTNNSFAYTYQPLLVFLVCSHIFNPKYFNRYMDAKYVDFSNRKRRKSTS